MNEIEEAMITQGMITREAVNEITRHCHEFQALKGVGLQRGCSGCDAGEDECWDHYCDTVLAPRYGRGSLEASSWKWK